MMTKTRSAAQKARRNERERAARKAEKNKKMERIFSKDSLTSYEFLSSENNFLFTPRETKLNEKAFAIRFILGGYSYSDYCSLCNNWSEIKLWKDDWKKLEKRVFSQVDLLAESLLRDRREKYTNQTLKLLLDCRWGTPGYTAYDATVCAFDVDNEELLFVFNVMRKSDSTNSNFDGSAKAMEGFGTEEICKQLKREGIEVAVILHDGDSSALANAKKIFPAVIEWRCLNHAAKNFRLVSLFFFWLPFLSSYLFIERRFKS